MNRAIKGLHCTWLCIYEIHIAIIHLIIHMNMKTIDPKWLLIQLHISRICRSLYYTGICKWMSFWCLVQWMNHMALICRPISQNIFEYQIVCEFGKSEKNVISTYINKCFRQNKVSITFSFLSSWWRISAPSTMLLHSPQSIMTSWQWNAFHIDGTLWEESTSYRWFPLRMNL